jgi:hypothetical protein
LNFHRNILTLLALLPSVQVHFGFQVYFLDLPVVKQAGFRIFQFGAETEGAGGSASFDDDTPERITLAPTDGSSGTGLGPGGDDAVAVERWVIHGRGVAGGDGEHTADFASLAEGARDVKTPEVGFCQTVAENGPCL